MLYMEADEYKELYKMYKILKDVPSSRKISVGDVVASCLQEQDRAYPSSDEEREWIFGYTKSGLKNNFDEWFEEIDEAYYYNSKTKQVELIDAKKAFDMDWDEHKYCFADEDKALDLMLEDMGKELPKNLEFKTFVTSYIPNLYGEHSEYSSEPLEILFDDMKFLLTIDWHRHNLQELENILSEKVFNSYVEKIWLNQEDNRIGVTLTSSKYRD